MKISNKFSVAKPVVSFEIFPPKADSGIEGIYDTLHALSFLKPDFISVTYGAGGEGNKGSVTAKIVERIKKIEGVESLAHLTCGEMTKSQLKVIVEDFKKRGIENILALKGDAEAEKGDFAYAKDLICELKKDDFCVGAAAYPEGHIACDDLELDLSYLKMKQDSGADFLIAQLCFENSKILQFIDFAKKRGISIPICAGVMPILSKSQVQRMVFLCGASLPSPIIKLLNKYGDEGESLQKAGIEYAFKQMQGLIDSGVKGVHLYVMNKPFIAEYCMKNLKVGGTKK